MSDNKKKHLGFISFAYAIGTILVVFGHSYPLGNAVVPAIMLQLRAFVYSFHMPLFFLIAGILVKHTHNDNRLGMEEYASFIKKKTIKLVTPYFVLGLLAFIPKYLVAQYLTDNVSLTFYYFIRTFLIPRENVWGHFWFISVLFILFCFSYLMLKSLQRTRQVVLLTGIFVALHFYPINIVWFGINDVCIYGLYFWIGILVSDFLIGNQDKFFSLSTGVCTAFAAVLLFNGGPLLIKAMTNIKGVFLFLGAILMIYSIISCGIVYQRKGHSYLDWMNGKTFTMFLLSWPCQAVVEICLNKILKLNSLLVMPAMFLAGLCGPLIVVWLYKDFKVKKKFLKIIVGIN